MFKVKNYSQHKDEFAGICENLRRLGEQGHEHIILKNREGFWYPDTTAKPKWYEVIHYFYKPQHSRYATISTYITEFLQINQDLFAKDSLSMSTLYHLKSKFISKPSLHATLQTTILKINGPEIVINKIQFYEAKEQLRQATEQNQKILNDAQVNGIKLFRKARKHAIKVAVEFPFPLEHSVESKGPPNFQSLRFTCKEGTVEIPSWRIEALKGSKLPENLNVDFSHFNKDIILIFNDILSGTKLPETIVELTRLYALTHYFKLKHLSTEIGNALLIKISEKPESILDALMCYYHYKYENTELEELLINKLICMYPKNSKIFPTWFAYYWGEILRNDSRDPFVLCMMGLCHRYTSGEPFLWENALKYLSEASKYGHTLSQNMYAHFSLENNKEELALSLFTQTANKGSALGLYYVGRCYEKGYGVAQDSSEALFFYTLAAEKGNLQALNNLGNLYILDEHIEKGVAYKIKAAERGLADAQYELGTFYRKGFYFEKNLQTANELFLKAGKQNHATAQASVKVNINEN